MSEDTTKDTPDTPEDKDTPDTPEVDNTPDKPEDKDNDSDTVPRAELRRVIEQRDKVKAELRKLTEGKGKDTDGKDSKPDPADTLRNALRRTAATSVLSGVGITDKDDQAAVLSVLSVDTLPVDKDGNVDTDTLGDTLSTLRRVFGSKVADKPRRPDTRPRSDDGPSDPDKMRYARIMGGRRAV